MKRGSLQALIAAVAVLALRLGSAAAEPASYVGDWILRADQGDVVIEASLELHASGAGLEGRSGPLDTLALYPLRYSGTMTKGRLRLTVSREDLNVGALELQAAGAGLTGAGEIFGTPVVVTAVRPSASPRAARVLAFNPSRFHVATSNRPSPVLQLVPGDIVRTRTVDAYGVDENGRAAAMPGNPGVGPFFVVGAMPGDTLDVHVLKLTLNRGSARMARLIAPAALTPGYPQSPPAEGSTTWVLDPDAGVARIERPSPRLAGFSAPLRPMIGVVGVAPPAGLAVPNSDLGEWGGNLDFPAVREGATVHLPVFAEGALLFLGDAHALQGDGEITGQGLETSMAVEFQVGLTKHDSLGQPWLENAEGVMVSGIGGSLDEAFQRATAGLARWLKARYQLDDADVAAVMGSSARYQIAEVVDPKIHVAASLSWATLARISPPPTRP